MIERGKDDFGRPYVSAGCDACDSALKDYFYVVDIDTKMLCLDCAVELAKDKLIENGAVSIDRMFLDLEEDNA